MRKTIRCIKSFSTFYGPGKRSGRIEEGDVILSIGDDGVPDTVEEVLEILKSKPLSLTLRNMAQFEFLKTMCK